MSSAMLSAQSKKPDAILLAALGITAILGLIMLASASVVVGAARFGDGSFFIKRQAAAFIIGLILAWFAYRLPYRRWQEISFPLFAASIVFLALVFFPVIGAGATADRWLNFYFFTFQPSELAKLALILYLPAWLASRGRNALRDFKTGLAPFLGLMLTIFALIIAQPDMGTLIIVGAIAMALYLLGGANLKHFFVLLLAAFLVLALAVKFAPYRASRIATFFNPSADTQKTSYHINQALIAVGSGGVFGRGLGQSRQKFLYLPEASSDSLFAVAAEELGFVGAAGTVLLFILILWRGIIVARRCPDNYGKLVAAGIVVWFCGQAFINIAAMTRVLPLTGVPLPFMSYGGSALVMAMAAAGILLNISGHSSLSLRTASLSSRTK